LRAGCKGPRALQPGIEVLEIPVAAMLSQDGGEGKAAAAMPDRIADHGIEIRTDAIGAALIDRVAGNAFGEDPLTRGGIRRRQQRSQSRAVAALALCLATRDRIAPFFHLVVLVGPEVVRTDARQAQRNDAS